MFACMTSTAIISLISVKEYTQGIERAIGANEGIKVASLVVFALLGFPLAVCITELMERLGSFPHFFLSFVFISSKVSPFHVIVAWQITYSVPFAVTAELTADSGGGQGLCCMFALMIFYAASV